MAGNGRQGARRLVVHARIASMTSERGRRVPPRLTPSYIENAALHYLERFASSRANLNRVLTRKARRALDHWGGDPAEAAAWIAAAIDKLAGLGYLDDGAYARMKTAGLARRGASARRIEAALAAKGVAADLVRAALDARADDHPDPERAAAIALARRRRLGPFRADPATRGAQRDRDLAALGRAGFAWELARAVIDADSPEALDD